MVRRRDGLLSAKRRDGSGRDGGSHGRNDNEWRRISAGDWQHKKNREEEENWGRMMRGIFVQKILVNFPTNDT